MTAPALRRWIQLGLIGKTAKGKAREGWALKFTCHDIATLALIKPMAEFGVPVVEAHKISVRVMREFAGPWSGDEPPQAWWSSWGPNPSYCYPPGDPKRQAGLGCFPLGGCSQQSAWTSPAHLALDPQALIRRAIERAMEAAEASEQGIA